MSTPVAGFGNRPVEQLKVAELREELRRRGLAQKGAKKDLVERLEEAIRQDGELASVSNDNAHSPSFPVDLNVEEKKIDEEICMMSENRESDVEKGEKESCVLPNEVMEQNGVGSGGQELDLNSKESTEDGNVNVPVSDAIVKESIEDGCVKEKSILDGIVEEKPIEAVSERIVQEKPCLDGIAKEAISDRTVEEKPNLDGITKESVLDGIVEEKPISDGTVKEPISDGVVEEKPILDRIVEEPISDGTVKQPISGPISDGIVEESVIEPISEGMKEAINEPNLEGVEKEPIMEPISEGIVKEEPILEANEKELILDGNVKQPIPNTNTEEQSMMDTNEEKPIPDANMKEPIVDADMEESIPDSQVKEEKTPIGDDLPLPSTQLLKREENFEAGKSSPRLCDNLMERDLGRSGSSFAIESVKLKEGIHIETDIGEKIQGIKEEIVGIKDETVEIKDEEMKDGDEESPSRNEAKVSKRDGEEKEEKNVITGRAVESELLVDSRPKRKEDAGGETRQQEPAKRQRKWNSGNNLTVEVAKPLTTGTVKEIISPGESGGDKGSAGVAKTTTPKIVARSRPPPPTPSALKKAEPSSTNGAPEQPRVVPPSSRPASTSLRIDRFLRPFTLKAVKELLSESGTVLDFWMDQIKTHCYVRFPSTNEATATRNKLHGYQWPPTFGHPLSVDFVDPEEVKARCNGQLEKSTTPTTPSTSSFGGGGGAGAVLTHPLPPPPPMSARERLLPPPPPPPKKEAEIPAPTLDDLFKKTRAKPHIYYLPLGDEEVSAKLAAKAKEQPPQEPLIRAT